MIPETPVDIEIEGARLFGMLTHPDRPNGVGVMIIQGGDTVNVSLQRNRLAVRMARELASRGYTCLRFDYHGLGESTGVIGELRLSSPFTEDAAAAADVLRSQPGVDRLVLVGACFSSRTALSTAAGLRDVAAVVMATPPIGSYERTEAVAERMARDRSIADYVSLALRRSTLEAVSDPVRRRFYLKLARSKAKQLIRRVPVNGAGALSWVSPQLLDPLDEMVKRHVPVLIAYGVDDPLLREFDRASAGRLGEILRRSNGSVEVVRDLPGVIHGFPAVPGQEAFVNLTYEWIDEVTVASGPEAAVGRS